MSPVAQTNESGVSRNELVNLESSHEIGDYDRNIDIRLDVVGVTQDLFGNEDEEDEDKEDNDDDSGTDYFNTDKAGTQLLRAERSREKATLPDTFQTSQLLYYERFKAYQDYVLGDCKTSEVKAFTADYLEKVVELCDWQALWCSDVFDVLVEVVDVDFKDLKACVKLLLPMQCEVRGCELNEEAMSALLEATLHKVPLQDLQVVYDETGDLDTTALALEHLRFFYQHIWRIWDEEDEDDDFDYFVRCVEPRLRLYYDILEDRVPTGLVVEYHSLLARCSTRYKEFSSLRNGMSSDSESELDNVSMVEGLRLYEQMEALKRKLRIIENPLLRYVLGYKGNSAQQSREARGPRECGGRSVHVVSETTTASQLQSLLTDKLLPEYDQFHVQFHSDPVLAVSACYEGDAVLLLPGHYCVTSSISIADSVTVEGFGLPDEVTVEKKNKGDTFVESTGGDVKLSNIKFIQHDAIEGILCVRQGKLEMENCVLQCETTGVIVRTSAQLTMNMCDLYGSKGAGIEIYPGSVCNLVGNGIHHCKEGVLIKDFADELDVAPRIVMENNVIHNNEGYGVILVKPNDGTPEKSPEEPAGEEMATAAEGEAADEERGTEAEGEERGEKPTPSHDPPKIVVEECHTSTTTVSSSSSGCAVSDDVPLEFVEGNGAIQRELVATSAKKRERCHQRTRAMEAGSTRPDEGLLEQEMFVSIQGNQFRRNGMGSFGTFLY
ncbi:SHC SH2 domain-binding protein 1 [Aplochiton taeniatus]